MAYYSNGTNVASLAGAVEIANAGISSLFQGMNIMTTLDLPNGGFSDGARIPLTGYKWNGAVISYINVSLINSLRKNINIGESPPSMTSSREATISVYPKLPYPIIFFVVFQARGGAGGAWNYNYNNDLALGGGGSGFYASHKVVVLPGSSFSVTHRGPSAEFALHVGGSAYVDGTYVAWPYSTFFSAASGQDATEEDPGVGFRNGGFPERKNESAPQLAEGAGIAANALSLDGYAYPAHAIYGGQGGKARAPAWYSADVVANGRGGGGGGASAGCHLAKTPAGLRTGGGGGFARRSSDGGHAPESGSFGGGGGGAVDRYNVGEGGDSYTIVFS